MRLGILGALMGAGLVVVSLGSLDPRAELLAEPLAASAAAQGGAAELIALAGPADDKGQLLTVIDPRQRVMGVYHVARADGRI